MARNDPKQRLKPTQYNHGASVHVVEDGCTPSKNRLSSTTIIRMDDDDTRQPSAVRARKRGCDDLTTPTRRFHQVQMTALTLKMVFTTRKAIASFFNQAALKIMATCGIGTQAYPTAANPGLQRQDPSS